MSPILTRPIREQFEHNRVILVLQTRLRHRYLVGVNLGDEREATGVRSGAGLVYPDLLLTNTTGARRLHGVVEVETAESVNHLEAMAEWVHFGKVRGAFYLYVPAGTTDIARRLCTEYRVSVTEIWSYLAVGDQMRFTMTHRSARAASRAAAAARRTTKATQRPAKAAKPTAKAAKRTAKATKRTAKATKRTATVSSRAAKAKRAKAGKRTTKTTRRATQAAKRTAMATKRTTKGAKRTSRSTKRAARGSSGSRKR